MASNGARFWTCALLIVMSSLTVTKGFAEFVDPPSGSIVVLKQGAINATTLSCSIFHQGSQISTQWTIRNFNNISGLQTIHSAQEEGEFFFTGTSLPYDTSQNFLNQLVIGRASSRLNGSTIYCGTGIEPDQAHFNMRILFLPGAPMGLRAVDNAGTWSCLSWQQPSDRGSGIRHYQINITVVLDIVLSQTFQSETIVESSNNINKYNITGLLPGTTYQLTMVAVSEVEGVVGQGPAATLAVTTDVIAPEPVCTSPPSLVVQKSKYGNFVPYLVVAWDYLHTGGIPLTQQLLSYNFDGDNDLHLPLNGDLRDMSQKMLNVSIPTSAGAYQFHLTATNNQGSASVDCLPLQLDVTYIQLILLGVSECQEWIVPTDSDQKLQHITQEIYINILNTCSCGFALVKQTFQCLSLDQSQGSIIFHAHIITTQNETTIVQRHLEEWTLLQPFVMVEGVRLQLKSACQFLAFAGVTGLLPSDHDHEILPDCTIPNSSSISSLPNTLSQALLIGIILLAVVAVLLALSTISLAIALRTTCRKMRASHSIANIGIINKKDKQNQQDVQIESCSAYNVVVDSEPDIKTSNTDKVYENVF